MKQRIKAVMSVALDVDPQSIGDDAAPNTIPNWDSHRHMILMLALEDEFGVRFSDQQIPELLSFQKIVESLTQLTQKSGNGSTDRE